mgnify:CR=1 FL=1
MSTIGERIFEVKNHFFGADRGSNKKFADAIGVNPNVVSNWFSRKDGIGNSVIEKILEAFPSVDKGWLVGGNGEMLNNKAENEKNPVKSYSSGVPYYNVDFIGGFDLILNDQTINPEYYIDFKQYNSADCWCNVTGHSMEPEINQGDIIALKELHDWRTYIPSGEIYGLVTTEHRTIKKVCPSPKEGYLRLIPTNKSPEYVPQDVPISIVIKVYKVLGCMKRL